MISRMKTTEKLKLLAGFAGRSVAADSRGIAASSTNPALCSQLAFDYAPTP
jgi:hypothetical protein